ncbi:MAG: hypothetical protein AB7O73_12190, partial [Bacteroidia bacterium]
GYYEYYNGENLIKKDEFKNVIALGDLRPTNNLSIKIWAYGGPYYSDLKNIRYTFEDGFIQPVQLKTIRQDKFIFWLNDFGVFNLIGMICFLITLVSGPIYFLLHSVNKKPPSPPQEHKETKKTLET